MRQHVLRLLTGLLVSIIPAAGLRAQSSAAGVIHGQVVRAGSRTAIASAMIDVAKNATGVPAGRVISSADGTFRLSGLSPGEYHVSIRALGFAPRALPVVALSTSRPDVDVAAVA